MQHGDVLQNSAAVVRFHLAVAIFIVRRLGAVEEQPGVDLHPQIPRAGRQALHVGPGVRNRHILEACAGLGIQRAQQRDKGHHRRQRLCKDLHRPIDRHQETLRLLLNRVEAQAAADIIAPAAIAPFNGRRPTLVHHL